VTLAEVFDTKVLTCDGSASPRPWGGALCRARQTPGWMLIGRLMFSPFRQRLKALAMRAANS
jgi:hypothetical protein